MNPVTRTEAVRHLLVVVVQAVGCWVIARGAWREIGRPTVARMQRAAANPADELARRRAALGRASAPRAVR